MDVLWFLLIGSVAGGFHVASMKCPSARLARATAGMTQIVASRHCREMLPIDASHTSPIATVTSRTH